MRGLERGSVEAGIVDVDLGMGAVLRFGLEAWARVICSCILRHLDCLTVLVMRTVMSLMGLDVFAVVVTETVNDCKIDCAT